MDDIVVVTADNLDITIKFNYYEFSNFTTVGTTTTKTLYTIQILTNPNQLSRYFQSESLFKPGILFKIFPFLSLNKKYTDSELTVASK